MHANDMLRYGHLTLLRALDGLTEAQGRMPDVCGVWSVADILAHLASYEWTLVDVLAAFPAAAATPLFARFLADGQRFNDEETAARQGITHAEILAEYEQAHAQAAALLARLTPEQCRTAGALPWYGAEYDLDDFLVYTFYAHKREHAAQIDVFRDRLARGIS